jgi:hypothetical protein
MSESPYPKIDKLRAKFDADKPLTLREVCFVLWAEHCVCSAQYLMFAYWVKQNKFPMNSKFKWKIWKSLFDGFAINDYPTLRNDLDLNVKVTRLNNSDKLFK